MVFVVLLVLLVFVVVVTILQCTSPSAACNWICILTKFSVLLFLNVALTKKHGHCNCRLHNAKQLSDWLCFRCTSTADSQSTSCSRSFTQRLQEVMSTSNSDMRCLISVACFTLATDFRARLYYSSKYDELPWKPTNRDVTVECLHDRVI